MKKQQKKTKEITAPVYMMNRELSWLKFNERVLNEAGNPRVPLAERLTFAAIYQSNLDEFYRVRVGTLMDQMEASEIIRENKTNMTSEEQMNAILQATRDLDQKKAAIYEQLMGELEPYGVRLINFKNYEIREKALLRITRNADIDTETIYDENLDYRDAMENLIKQRRRMNPVRMELSRDLNKKMISSLCKELHVDKEHVFLTRVPLDMSFVFGLQGYLRNTDQDKLFYQRRAPRMTPELDGKSALIPQIMKKDVLLSYPFENIRYFINLLNEAAQDDSVVSIKMTLYRLADKSQIVDALVDAAENGKEVVVLVELRARFDEESNIEYSRKLEEAGCRVIYGLNGYKVHSKLCLISRKTDKGVSYITQIGTGNYNEKTSALYTDLSLITANQEIGKEAAEVFAALLKGEVVEKSNLLLVAPKCLQNRVLDMIQEEIDQVKQGKEGYIGIKINSLTDKVIINKLVEASQAGVKIEMVVRGICCLIPEIKGYTENIKVISIVGRYLEHSRIYRFGTKEREKIYIASADFMTRNTVRRVEVAAPVLNEKLKERLDWMFETMMNDDEKGKRLTETGNYADRSLNDVKLNSQEIFYAMAYSNAEKTQKKRED